jgi:opacity protein-like surface antigen
MKRNIILSALSAAALTASSFAGDKNIVTPAAPPPPQVYGTGFYVGIQAGINAFQDLNSRRFSFAGNDVLIEPQDNIGFAGGLKLGYVFGTSTVRPAIEADLYYNGFEVDVNSKVNGNTRDFRASADYHSGAFLGNFVLRFAFDRFQPYVGAGIGGWVSDVDDVRVTVRNRTRQVDGGNNSGLAWQIIGGADYYFTEKFSAFAEYKYLNYEDGNFNGDVLDQHIVVLGLRIHF